MAEAKKYTLAELSVNNIDSFIFSSIKTQQLLIKNEKVNQVFEKVLLFCQKELSLTQQEKPGKDESWYILVEEKLGTLKLLLPTKELAQKVLGYISLWGIEECPGLELNGTTVPCAWTTANVSQAIQTSQTMLRDKRFEDARPSRAIWPFAVIASAYGMSAVERTDDGQYIGTVDLVTHDQAFDAKTSADLKALDQALRSADSFNKVMSKDTKLVLEDNLEGLAQKSPSKKIALVRLSASNLPSLATALAKDAKKDATTLISAQVKLHQAAQKATDQAIVAGLRAAIIQDLQGTKFEGPVYKLPMEMCVHQGADLLFFMRSDRVFRFVDAFTASYESQMKEAGHPSSLCIGMVIMQSKYPMSRALKLSEQLLASSQAAAQKSEQLKSWIDYVVLTNDIEQNIELLRKNSYTATDGGLLTGKPYVCGCTRQRMSETYIPNASLADIVADAKLLSRLLPISSLRRAIDECHAGTAYAKRAWEKMYSDLKLKESTRKTILPSFERIFSTNFFIERKGARPYTLLGDYLEVRHLFSPDEDEEA